MRIPTLGELKIWISDPSLELKASTGKTAVGNEIIDKAVPMTGFYWKNRDTSAIRYSFECSAQDLEKLIKEMESERVKVPAEFYLQLNHIKG